MTKNTLENLNTRITSLTGEVNALREHHDTRFNQARDERKESEERLTSAIRSTSHPIERDIVGRTIVSLHPIYEKLSSNDAKLDLLTKSIERFEENSSTIRETLNELNLHIARFHNLPDDIKELKGEQKDISKRIIDENDIKTLIHNEVRQENKAQTRWLVGAGIALAVPIFSAMLFGV